MKAEELRELNKNRKITQICVVTENYQETIKFLTERFQWGPWSIGVDAYEGTGEKDERGIAADGWSMYFGVTTIGEMEIEIIQPIYGLPIFESFLRERGTGIHHFKESIRNLDELNTRVSEFKELGNETCFSGTYKDEHYIYFDSYKDIGSYLEMSNDVGGNGDLSLNPGYVGQYPEE